MDKISYALGLGIGQQIKSMNIENFSIEDFAKSISDVMEGKETAFSNREAQIMLQEYFTKKQKEEAQAHIAEGKAYLDANAKKEGVTVTKSGLQYEVLQEGTGKSPKATDTVRCHYEGRLLDGTVFDSSYKRGEPESGHYRLDRRRSTDEGRCKVPLHHPLSVGLRRTRCWRKHTTFQHTHLRRRTYKSVVNHKLINL